LDAIGQERADHVDECGDRDDREHDPRGSVESTPDDTHDDRGADDEDERRSDDPAGDPDPPSGRERLLDDAHDPLCALLPPSFPGQRRALDRMQIAATTTRAGAARMRKGRLLSILQHYPCQHLIYHLYV